MRHASPDRGEVYFPHTTPRNTEPLWRFCVGVWGLHLAATSYVPVSVASSPREAFPPGDIRVRVMTHHLIRAYVGKSSWQSSGKRKIGSTRKDVTMDRYPETWSLLRMLPGEWRRSLLDHAEERTNGIHALDRSRPSIPMRRLTSHQRHIGDPTLCRGACTVSRAARAPHMR
jgi:hypothetical protein